MKSARFLIIFFKLINIQLSAQVFTRADFAYANQWYTYQTDTNPSTKIKVRYTGPSNVWNFIWYALNLWASKFASLVF